MPLIQHIATMTLIMGIYHLIKKSIIEHKGSLSDQLATMTLIMGIYPPIKSLLLNIKAVCLTS